MCRRVTFEQYKKELIAFFKQVNNEFEKNGIFWWAHSGTLLGAKRDGKFIPWDDDIDMAMTAREFYSKIEIIKQIGSNANYVIADKLEFNGLNSSRLISGEKIIVEYEGKEYITSLFIDIMIGIPVKKASRIRSYYWFISNRYMLLFSSFWKPMPSYKIKDGYPKKINLFIHILIWLARLFVLPLWLYKLIEKRTIKKASKNDDNHMIELHYGWSHLQIFYNLNEMEKTRINGEEIYIPSQWNEELITRYGVDYLTPPPNNRRRPKHFILSPYKVKDKKVFPYIIK